MGRIWLGLCLLIGCVKSSSINCDDGRVCADSLVCDNANHLCVPSAQRDACGSTPDGAICSWGANTGRCTSGTCLATCGDGATNLTGEECDDGNVDSSDGCSAQCTLEAPQWERWTSLWEPRAGHSTVFDALRAQLYVFGGTNERGDLGSAWKRSRGTNHDRWTPIAVAPARHFAATAYDSARHVVVLFGGLAGITAYNETWEFDGTTWTKRSPTTSPPPRVGASMAFDQVSGKIVLFGGSTDQTVQTAKNDTWEYDGTTWTQRFPATPPGTRTWAAMAYDSTRQKIVLFSGCTNKLLPTNDTWEYSAGTWTEVSPTTSPLMRCGAAAAELPGAGIVVHGGFFDATNDANDTWIFNGTTWTQIVTPISPPARRYSALAFDATGGKLTLVGGTSGNDVASDEVWELSNPTTANAEWNARDPGFSPLPRIAPVVRVPTKQRVLAFSGNTPNLENDTWLYGRTAQDLEWSEQTSAMNPPTRFFSSLVYDSKRDKVILFGGVTYQGNVLDDTWEWQNFSWSPVTVATKPPGRQHTAMAFDERRNVVVMFGGQDMSGGLLDDTWEYDGTSWTKRNPPSHPAMQAGAAMTYDVIGNRIVLFTIDAQTWTYDDGTWTQLTPAASPPARALASFVSDKAINHTLLFGGSVEAGTKSDIWSLEGNTWKEIVVAGETPPGRFVSGAAVLASEHAVVMFGGYSGQASLGDTWLFRFK